MLLEDMMVPLDSVSVQLNVITQLRTNGHW